MEPKPKKVKTRTYFARPDKNKTKKEGINQTCADILLWVAEMEEKKGNIENAERLRMEAAKPIEKK